MSVMKRTVLLCAGLLFGLCGCRSSAAHGIQPTEPAKQLDLSNLETAYVQECIEAFLFDGDALPAKTPMGTSLEWSVEQGHATLEQNVLHKTEGALEYEPLVLSVAYGENQLTFDSLQLLDEPIAYVISYFTSEGTDSEQLKLAYTFNGEYWFKVHEDKGILKPSIGTKRLRDPALVRKENGTFSLLATQGYDSDSIYVYDSDDLASYKNERMILLNVSSKELPMSGKQAWAPEAFYDPFLKTYVIFWSSPEDGGIFYSTSDDLITASYPKKMNDPGYPVIDITMVHTTHGWTAILKDEREPMEDYSQVIRGNGLTWASIDTFSEPIYQRHQVEGPMILKSMESEAWYVVVDDYTRSAYKMLKTADIESGTFQELEDTELMIPLEQPSHANAIRVTWKELERLNQAFGQ